MARIVLANFGSLGDLHPVMAIGLELQRRGHSVLFTTTEFYREKIESAGFEFRPLRPNINSGDSKLATELMDKKSGSKKFITDILLPNLRPMFDDLIEAVKDADVLISSETVYAAMSVTEKTGIKWVTFGIIPISFLSGYDPPVFPMAPWLRYFRFMPPFFHQSIYRYMRRKISPWTEPYKKFRREIGLDEDHDFFLREKYSRQLTLALFSKLISPQQRDWHEPTLQAGFCFYDGEGDLGKMPEGLEEFLDAGGPPIVFTLGSVAILEPGNFFTESISAAKELKKRAVVLYGISNEPPSGLDENIAGFPYAPHSRIFSRAACVVHQGGVSTISHILRAGVPMLVVPEATYDQYDNAARCFRLGVARVLYRGKYRRQNAVKELGKLFSNPSYRARSQEAKKVIETENGTRAACDAIEDLMKK
jgi:UDP:flavonoid glycosyltransferase YjiC (YdhE family)